MRGSIFFNATLSDGKRYVRFCFNVRKLSDDRIITFSIHCLKTKIKTVRKFVSLLFLIITGSLVSHKPCFGMN